MLRRSPATFLGRRILARSLRPVLAHRRPQQSCLLHTNTRVSHRSRWVGAWSAVVAITAALYSHHRSRHSLEAAPLTAKPPVPTPPLYTRKQVAEHNCKDTGIWVTFGTGVYDITEFVASHPGGEKILLAAGAAVEPYWNVYTIHDSAAVRQILQQYKIGELDPKELLVATAEATRPVDISDPFSDDPVRSPVLVVRSQKPFNAETPPAILGDHFITPNDVFYVRHHLPVPRVEAPNEDDIALEVQVSPDRTVSISWKQLRTLPRHDVTATLQCAGNRRKEMERAGKIQGLSWDRGAIGNAVWSGVYLRDVFTQLLDLEDTEDRQHVQFDGRDGYGSSIPSSSAFDPNKEVLLAFEMNGETLPRDHGYPLRAIIPGTVAARSVKWLHKVTLATEESHSHWQRNDYKGFSPSENWDKLDYTKAESIQEMPVQSAILEPSPSTVLEEDAEEVTVRGYAWSGGGHGITRVDVSADGGRTWHNAELVKTSGQKRNRVWAWTLWEATLPLPSTASEGSAERGEGVAELVCKAVDTSYNTQPDGFDGIYNRRGVLSNAWQRMQVKRKRTTTETNGNAQASAPAA